MKEKTKKLLKNIVLPGVILTGYFAWTLIQDRSPPDIEPTSTPTAQVVQTVEPPEQGEYFKICSWNTQILGDTKAGNLDFMNFTADMLDDCDISIVQEIRDKDSSAFWDLCDLMGSEYNCIISSRAGYTNSKEQYGFFFRNYVSLDEFIDLNDENTIGYEGFREMWSRPPAIAKFSLVNTYDSEDVNYSFYIITIHTKPDDVPNETQNLEDYVESFSKYTEKNTMIIGDGNWDSDGYDRDPINKEDKDRCQNYYNRDEEFHFVDWLWMPRDDEDTTSGDTFCAYDRAIVNEAMIPEIRNYGIYTQGIVPGDVDEGGRSDHYMIMMYLEPFDKEK